MLAVVGVHRDHALVEQHVHALARARHHGEHAEAVLPEVAHAAVGACVRHAHEQPALLEAGARAVHLGKRLAHVGAQVVVLEHGRKRRVGGDAPDGPRVVVIAHAVAAPHRDERAQHAVLHAPEAVAHHAPHHRAHAREVVAVGVARAREREHRVGAVLRQVRDHELGAHGLLVDEAARHEVVQDRGAKPHALARQAQAVDEDARELGGVVDELEVDAGDRAVLLHHVEAAHLEVVEVHHRGDPAAAVARGEGQDGVVGAAHALDDAVCLHVGVDGLGDVALVEHLLHVEGVERELAGGGEHALVGVEDDHGVAEHLGGAPGVLPEVVGAEKRVEHPLAQQLQHRDARRQVEEQHAQVLVAARMGDEHDVARGSRVGGDLGPRMDEQELALGGAHGAGRPVLEAAQADEQHVARGRGAVLGREQDVGVEQLRARRPDGVARQLVDDRSQLHVHPPRAGGAPARPYFSTPHDTSALCG